MPTLSPYAKALSALILAFLVQLGVVIGTGGLPELAALTVGQWIQIVLQTATVSGFTYAVPNVTAKLQPLVEGTQEFRTGELWQVTNGQWQDTGNRAVTAIGPAQPPSMPVPDNAPPPVLVIPQAPDH